VRLIHPKLADPLETFTVPRLYAIAVKGNKTDYELDEQNPVQTLVCVHSLFPHAGSGPCWYVKPKSQQTNTDVITQNGLGSSGQSGRRNRMSV